MIFRVLAWASAVETNGVDSAGARPAAAAMTPDVFRKARRVTERFRLCPPDVIAFLLFAGAGGDFVDSTPEVELATGSGHPVGAGSFAHAHAELRRRTRRTGHYLFGSCIMDMRDPRDNRQNCHTGRPEWGKISWVRPSRRPRFARAPQDEGVFR